MKTDPIIEAEMLATEAGIFKLPIGAQRAAAEALLEQHPHLIGHVVWNDAHVEIEGREYRNPDYGFTRAGHRGRDDPYREELAACLRAE